MKTSVIYEDNDVLVACKPVGLATQTAKVGQADMVSELKNYLAADKREAADRDIRPKQPAPYLGVVHRLDQPVEGLLVFAKNRETAAALTKQLSEGALHKQYYAVICGKPANSEGTLVDYLYKNENNMAQLVTEGDAHFGEAKKAVLHYRVLQTVSVETVPTERLPMEMLSTVQPNEISLMEICLETGRFHQIRAQMAHGGMPLLGDAKYGPEAAEASARLGVRTVALCAYSVSFLHPAAGKKMEFETIPRGKAFSYFDLKRISSLR